MRSRWLEIDARAGVVALAACLALVAQGRPALAQGGEDPAGEPPPADAQAEFDVFINQGTELYEQGDYEAAAAAFKKAYALRPTANLLYNIGRIYEKAGNFEGAIAFYDRFVNEPDIEIEARQDALVRLKTLREIVDMRREKDRPEEPEEDPGPEVTPDPGPAPEPEVRYALPVTLLVAGGASLLAGGGFALATNRAAQQAESTLDYDEFQRLNQQGRTRALLADSLFITGGVLTVLGVVFLATAGPRDDGQQAIIAPAIGPDRVGVGFSWSF